MSHSPDPDRTGEDQGLNPEEMRTAIAEAHGHLIAKGDAPQPAVFDEPRKSRKGWLVLAVILLVGAVGGTAYLVVASGGSISAAEQEADLRWAMGQVVTRVEAFRMERGQLPTEGDLFGLLSDAVVYSVEGDGYRITGTAGSIRVEYDGSIPLGAWLEQSTSGGGP